jgi:hypothetical protein
VSNILVDQWRPCDEAACGWDAFKVSRRIAWPTVDGLLGGANTAPQQKPKKVIIPGNNVANECGQQYAVVVEDRPSKRRVRRSCLKGRGR